MRKSTLESKKWNEIHILSLNRRGDSRKKRKNQGKSHKSTTGKTTVICPEDFSLSSNFDGVVEVLQKIRTQSKRQKKRQRNEQAEEQKRS